MISRSISFSKDIEEDIKKRLLIIAEKCPVSKMLKNNIVIIQHYNYGSKRQSKRIYKW
jgi:uncharacterized OsmC-like protein